MRVVGLPDDAVDETHARGIGMSRSRSEREAARNDEDGE
jgi:hypothetical protein